MYLNDVEEGGETAFPVADNATYHENVSNHIILNRINKSEENDQ